jgi:hypothetical protein
MKLLFVLLCKGRLSYCTGRLSLFREVIILYREITVLYWEVIILYREITVLYREVILLYRDIILSNNSNCCSPRLFYVTAVSLSVVAIPLLRESGSTIFVLQLMLYLYFLSLK